VTVGRRDRRVARVDDDAAVADEKALTTAST
jgi:hypothetical protein